MSHEHGMPSWSLRRPPEDAPILLVLAGLALQALALLAARRGLVPLPVGLAATVIGFVAVMGVCVRSLRRLFSGPSTLRLGTDGLEVEVRGREERRIPYARIGSVELRSHWPRNLLIRFGRERQLTMRPGWFDSQEAARSFAEALAERVASGSAVAARELAARAAVGDRVLARTPWLSVGVGTLLTTLAAVTLRAGDGSPDSLVALGALGRPAVLEGEWQRLVTVGLLHSRATHIAVNAAMLVLMGSLLERVLGPLRFGLLLGASSLLGYLFFLALSPEWVVGASAGIAGVFGAWFSLNVFRQRELPIPLVLPPVRAAILGILLVAGDRMMEGVAAQAHLGGVLAGFVLTPLLCAGRPLVRLPQERPPRLLWAAAVVLAVLYGAGIVSVLLAAARLPAAGS